MKNLNHVLFCLIAGAAFFTSAHAQTVTTPDNGSPGIFWGPGGSNGYGESITVPLGATQLQSFTFDGLTSTSSSSFNYVTYIYAFNPSTRTESGSALFTSGVENVPASGTVSSTITPNITVVPGQTYIVLVTADGQVQVSPNSSTASASMDRSNGTYSGGGLIFTNNPLVNGFNATVWNNFGLAAFTAIFGSASFVTDGLTSNQQSVVGSVNNGITSGNATTNFTALVNALMPFSGSPVSLGAALNQLSPVAFGSFTSVNAFNTASFNTEARDNYAAGRRGGDNGTFLGGNGSLDANGLVINDPSYDSALASVHSRLLAWNPAPFNGTISDVADAVLGGVDMKDSKDMKSASVTDYSNPWNFTVRGNVVLAQGFSQVDIPHFDSNTESVELGVDYRFSPNFILGLTAGYGHTDATLDDFGSSATTDSYSPGFYASYADHGWYANVQGDYVHNAYTQARHIAFLGQTANSAPEGNEGVADLDGGYDFHRGALTFGPLAGVQYTHLSVDGFNESGSVADLSVNDQESDSLRSRLGGRVAYAFTRYGLVFRPHFDASWQHEFMDQSRGITSQFQGTGLGSFSVKTASPSRDFALVDLGLDADINRTVNVFLDYVVQAGQENYFGQSVQGGVKVGF